MSEPRLISLSELSQRLGLGKTKIYDLIKQERFPAPVKIGKSSRWSSEKVTQWINDLPFN